MAKIHTGTLSTIDPDAPESWHDSIFLTIDVDWAPDEVIAETALLLNDAGVKATWFLTHETVWIERLRSNPNFELGIHPNFNFLLNGDSQNGASASEVVDSILTLVPEARSVRSHSMLQSTNLLALFRDKGITHDSNTYVPEQANITLFPWKDWLGITKVPYCWEDDIACLSRSNSLITDVAIRPGLRVFDFHPIHIFLNTEDMSRYQTVRGVNDIEALERQRNPRSDGTRTNLIKLLDLIS